MFICAFCRQVQPAGTRAARIATEVRPHTHPVRRHAFFAPPDPSDRRRKKQNKRVKVTDFGGFGTQIVAEASACPSCAAQAPPPKPM